MEKTITKTTNFKYKEGDVKFDVSLTSNEEKNTTILLANNALKNLKESEFQVDFSYKTGDVWLKFSAHNKEQKDAMTAILQELINDIFKDLK